MRNEPQTAEELVRKSLSYIFLKAALSDQEYNYDALTKTHEHFKKFLNLLFFDLRKNPDINVLVDGLQILKTYSNEFLDLVSAGASVLNWNGENLDDLKIAFDNLVAVVATHESLPDQHTLAEKRLLTALGGHTLLPHAEQIPEDVKGHFTILACDKRGYCLVNTIDGVHHVDELRHVIEQAEAMVANQ